MPLPPEIKAAISQAVASGKFKSLSDIEEFVFALMTDYNRRAVPEMCDLSPEQVHGLLHSDWTSPTSVLRLSESLTAAELSQAPFYVNAKLFLRAAEEAPVKATTAGNLNRQFVGWMLERISLEPSLKESIYRTNKVINEEDVWPLHVLRVVLEVGGLLKKTKGLFKATKKGLGLAAEAKGGEFYAYLFRVFFKKFNLGYLDRMGDVGGLQQTIAFSFCVLGQIGDEWHSPVALKEILWLEAVRNEVLESSRFDNYLLWMTESRLLRPLVEFGLLDKQTDGDDKTGRGGYEVRKSALYDRFLSFRF